jgi:hypothetical protein
MVSRGIEAQRPPILLRGATNACGPFTALLSTFLKRCQTRTRCACAMGARVQSGADDDVACWHVSDLTPCPQYRCCWGLGRRSVTAKKRARRVRMANGGWREETANRRPAPRKKEETPGRSPTGSSTAGLILRAGCHLHIFSGAP